MKDTMGDVNTAFEQAQRDAKQLTERPDNETLLDLYALFKQATQGDNRTAQPGGFDFVGKAKWDAWTAKQGMTPDAAKAAYVALIASLR